MVERIKLKKKWMNSDEVTEVGWYWVKEKTNYDIEYSVVKVRMYGDGLAISNCHIRGWSKYEYHGPIEQPE